MEPKKVIDSIEGKMGFTPEIMNMMSEMNPEFLRIIRNAMTASRRTAHFQQR